MNPGYVHHLIRHAAAIRYLPPANKKPAAHALCKKIAAQLDAANDPRFLKQVR